MSYERSLRLRSLHFNPRSSCEERLQMASSASKRHHFNPRSSCEERQHGGLHPAGLQRFQSTLLMRGATTAMHVSAAELMEFQSTLLMRGATASQDAGW